MRKTISWTLVVLCLGASALFAQGGGGGMAQGPTAEVMRAYTSIKTNITGAASAMPEDSYGFKPNPDEMSFGQWVAHVADSQMNTCSRLNGDPQQLGAAQKTSKADLQAALKTSFDECDKAFAAMTDANALEMIAGGRGSTSRAGTLWGAVVHDNECYGSMAVYLRVKNIVPPSTANRGARGGGMQTPPAPPKK
jgi:hypothetical protein